MKPNIQVVDQSREFDITEKFFSITNKKGVISCGNSVFMRVSGYDPSELVGKPHNVIRHPDMPRCVFKLFWDFLNAGKVIGAYVKNRAKDGKYYWVYALASSIDDKYISIRIKPTSELFPVVQKLYAELLEHEDKFLGNERDAMESSTKLLLERLAELNYASYEEFLYDSLRAELTLHHQALKAENTGYTPNIDPDEASEVDRLMHVFENLDKLTRFGTTITESQSNFLSVEKELRMIATNTRYRATRLGADGRPLNVICDEISRARVEIDSALSSLTVDIDNIASAIKGAILHSCMGVLQVQMQQDFSQEMQSQQHDLQLQVAQYGAPLKEMNEIVHSASDSSLKNFTHEMDTLAKSLNEVDAFVQFLLRMIQVLNFTYVTGRSLLAAIGDVEEIDSILNGLKVASSRTSEDLSNLRNLLGDVKLIITGQ